MYKLFYAPGVCSMAVHVALNELGQDVELIKATIHGEIDPELAKVNPRNQVPVLVEGDNVIREGAAILIYLLDKHHSDLMPSSGIARAKALEWLCWGNATLHVAYSKALTMKKLFKDNDEARALGHGAMCDLIQKTWDEAEAHLSSNKYLAGDQVTIGDILMTVIANWGGMLEKPPVLGPNVLRVIREMIERPAYKTALERESVKYKAAA